MNSPAPRLTAQPITSMSLANPNRAPIQGRDSGVGCSGWCDPFARNRRSTERRGMGGKGHKGAWRATDAKLPRSLTTVYPRRCDDIPQSTPRWGKHQLRPPQVPGRERHPMAGDWSSTLRLRSGPKARMERRSARARRDDSAEHAAMVNASEGVMRRRQGEPAYSGYQAGPKGNGSSAWFANGNQAALDTGPGVKHRPKAAQSGCTERSNPSVALQHDRSREPPVCADGRDGPRSECLG